MPAIPLPPRPEDPRIGGINVRATGEEFGSEIPSSASPAVGQALVGLGGSLQNLGSAVGGYFAKIQGQKDDEAVATQLGKSSYQERYNDTILDYPDASGKGLAAHVSNDYPTYVDEQTAIFAKTGASAAAQRKFKLELLALAPGYVRNAAVAQSKMENENAIREADTALGDIAKDISDHGATSQDDFEKTAVKGDNIAKNKRGLDQNQKDDAVLKNRSTLATIRFDTLRQAAKTPAELATLIKELHTPYWKKQFDLTSYEKVEGSLAETAAVLAGIGAEAASDPNINNIRADPAKYDAEVAAGVKHIKETPGITPADEAKQVNTFLSNAAMVRFATLGEQAVTAGEKGILSGKINSNEEADAQITKLQKELADDPKWRRALTREQYNSLTDSLITRKNQLDAKWDEQRKLLLGAQNKLVSETNEKIGVKVSSVLERLDHKQLPPPSDMADIGELVLLIGKTGLSETNTAKLAEAFTKYTKLGGIRSNIVTKQNLIFEENKTKAGGDKEMTIAPDGTHIVHTPTGKHTPSGASIIKSDAGHAQVVAAIRDGTRVQGMTSKSYTILEGMSANARSHGVVRLVIVAGRGGGHKSHGAGTEWDIVGYQANGQVWTAEQRAAVARDGMHAGGNRVGLYEGGSHRNLLHIGYAHEGFPAAMWGAGGLTSGGASRNYSDPASRKLLSEFGGGGGGGGGRGGGGGGRGGGGAGGRGSSYEGALVQFESGWKNVWNTHETTKYGPAGGYFQIVTPTWERYGGLATGYKNAIDAPYEVQAQIAGKIKMKEWAPETLDKLRAAGFKVDPEATLAENIAANGGTLGTAGGDGAGGDGRVSLIEPGPVVSPFMTDKQWHEQQIIDNERQDLIQDLNTDPMTRAARELGVPLPDLLTPESYDKQAALYIAAKQAFELTPDQQQKPLSVGQTAVLSDLLASNDPDKMNNVWAGIARWPTQMQEAAYKQLDQHDPFGAAAGRLYASGRPDLANDAIRGNASLLSVKKNDVDVRWMADTKTWFEAHMADITRAITDPTSAAGLKSVADAIYARKYGTGNVLNEAAYQNIMEQVYGGKFDTVNSTSVIVPKGTTGVAMEAAFTVIDWKAVSVTHTEPIGEDPITHELAPIGPVGLASAHPIRITEGVYAFMDNDGGLWHTVTPDGKGVIYKANLTADVINEAAAKATSRANAVDPALAGFKPPDNVYFRSGFEPVPGETPPELPTPGPTPQEPATLPQDIYGKPAEGTGNLSTADEKQLQAYGDAYADALKRQGNASDEYVKNARKEFIDMTRARMSRQGKPK